MVGRSCMRVAQALSQPTAGCLMRLKPTQWATLHQQRPCHSRARKSRCVYWCYGDDVSRAKTFEGRDRRKGGSTY